MKKGRTGEPGNRGTGDIGSENEGNRNSVSPSSHLPFADSSITVTVIDYGMGNLRSVSKAFEKVGAQVIVSSNPAVIENAQAVVLPGVGAFGEAMRRLERYKITEPLKRMIASGKPFMGICLGYQLLFEHSQESPGIPGLGIFGGRVEKLPPVNKVPQMGWNQIEIKRDNLFFEELHDGEYFYFVHSFYPHPENKDLIACSTDYGLTFTSAISRGNLFACQYHPEKSGYAGMKLLGNFLKVAKKQSEVSSSKFQADGRNLL